MELAKSAGTRDSGLKTVTDPMKPEHLVTLFQWRLTAHFTVQRASRAEGFHCSKLPVRRREQKKFPCQTGVNKIEALSGI